MQGDTHRTFGELVRQARRAAGLTQEELAERAGISPRTISDLERGTNRAPQPATLRLLADALELSNEDRRQWQAMRRKHSSRDGQRSRWSTTGEAALNSTVPAPLDAFVGRDREIAGIVALLEDATVRALTLVGPGGVGKTRLALAVSRQLEGRFPHGIWFVNLAPVSDPGLVCSTIASTLGIPVSGREPALAALVHELRNSSAMLILDNFEQVAAAGLEVADLIMACPGIKVLATSRIPLRIQAEREYPIAPLALPDETSMGDIDILRRVEAIDLFEQRARAISADFAIDEHNGDVVAAICRRLDGLPLAIELASARTRLLPPLALLKRLEHRLPLLTSTVRNVPERHQTLRDTIAWSYELLEPAEQTLFRTLSVFRGGWTLEAVEHMHGHDEDVLARLEALVAHSLVRVREMPDGEPRYSMLETIAEFAQERLGDSDEADHRSQQHAKFFLALAEQAEHYFRGPHQEEWMDRLEDEHANIRAALQWSLAHARRGDGQAIVDGLRIVGAVWWFWYVRGHFREAPRQITTLVEQFRDQSSTDDTLILRPEAAIAYATALFVLSSLSSWSGEFEQSDQQMRESREIYQRFDRGSELATSIVFSGFGASDNGKFQEAEVFLQQAIAAFEEQEDTGGAALAHLGMGETWFRQGNYELAMSSLDRSLELFVEIEDTRGIAAVNALTGAVHLRQGRPSRARDLLSDSIRSRLEIGDKGGIAWCLECMAELALQETAPPDNPAMRAARLLGAAGALRNAIGSPVVVVARPEIERLTAASRARLSGSAFIAAWEAGRTMTLKEAASYALESGRDMPHQAPINP